MASRGYLLPTHSAFLCKLFFRCALWLTLYISLLSLPQYYGILMFYFMVFSPIIWKYFVCALATPSFFLISLQNSTHPSPKKSLVSIRSFIISTQNYLLIYFTIYAYEVYLWDMFAEVIFFHQRMRLCKLGIYCQINVSIPCLSMRLTMGHI